jgi:hypothetical protein
VLGSVSFSFVSDNETRYSEMTGAVGLDKNARNNVQLYRWRDGVIAQRRSRRRTLLAKFTRTVFAAVRLQCRRRSKAHALPVSRTTASR